MLPESSRLLLSARRALTGLAQDVAPGVRATLDAVDVVLCELLLRCDREFYRRHHARGIALAEAGLALAGDLGVAGGLRAPAAELSAEDSSSDAIWQRIDALLQVLETMVRVLAPRKEAAEFLARVVDWENDFHGRHAALAPPSPPAASLNFTRENLHAYLQQKFPTWPNLTVRDVRVLPGGFSKKTVLLDVRDDRNGDQSLVMRVEQPPRFGFWDGDQVENEFLVLQLIHEAGLLVPEVLWLESDATHVGQKFLVTRRAPGRNVGSATGATAATPLALVRDAIRHLVHIHNTRLDAEDPRIRNSHLAQWAGYRTLREATTAWVEHWLGCIRDKNLRASPLTVRMMEWLRANVPACDEAPSLLHGDFGLHNILVEDGRVSSILDWEYLSFGDPAEDIALLAISFGGVLSQEDIMAMYLDCGGRPISEYRQRYFDVLYSMKFIVPAENGLKMIQDHEEASFGLCKFGFLYSFAGVHDLNRKIARAEAVKPPG